jgi:hypothetical protein
MRSRSSRNTLNPPVEPQKLRFSAQLPGGKAGPLWKLSVEALGTPDAGGERLRLRAHIETNLASVLRPALKTLRQRLAAAAEPVPQPALAAPIEHAPTGLPALQAMGGALRPLSAQARNWLQRRVAARAPAWVQRAENLAEPLLRHDFSTWLELEMSNAPLVAGAQALLPHADRLASLGIEPQTGPHAPPIQNWQGRIGDETAQVSLLRLDARHLPDAVQQQLGGKPLQVAAALVNLARRRR